MKSKLSSEQYRANARALKWPGVAGKPRLLDLFCCAGGAGVGYANAGFDVIDLIQEL